MNQQKNREFEIGQRWSYHARPQDLGSTLVVVEIDKLPSLGKIVHIALEGLAIPNPVDPSEQVESIPHMPFLEESIEESVIKIEEVTDELPDYEMGYQQWRQAFEAGEAAVFSIPVAEAVDVIEEAFSQSEEE